MTTETPAERFSRLISEARARKDAGLPPKFSALNKELEAKLEKDNENGQVSRANLPSNTVATIDSAIARTAESSIPNKNIPALTGANALQRKLAELRASNSKSASGETNGTNNGNPATASIILGKAAIPNRTQATETARNNNESVAEKLTSPSSPSSNTLTDNIGDIYQGVGRTGELISYNENQLKFIQTAGTGESCILIGAAGTGKTTSMRGATQNLIQSGIAGILQSDGHSYLPDTGVPGIVVCAYTRRATANIRKQMPDDLKNNCITIHKLLEYQPVYEEVLDPNTGENVTKMFFTPTRNTVHPLPPTIHTIIIEEASMVAVELYEEIMAACPHKPQIIFLGDIQQLPPVFGAAILGFKMLELETVELTEVYRQALESPIIRLAHRILSGNPIPAEEYPEWKVPGQLTIHPWKKKLAAETALRTAAAFFNQAYDAGGYDPELDQILIPFNKSFGTLELNKYIAQHLARKRQAIVYEVIAGFNTHYFSVGDKVLVEREDATIIDISINPLYSGKQAQPHSQHLDYWGYNSGGGKEVSHKLEMTEDEADFFLDSVGSVDDGERVRKCSHVITVQMADTGVNAKIDKAAEVNNMLLAYALTVHKSQGSEWRKVFLVFHQSHATMLQRELLYTGVTRAKEELYIICEPESFTKGIISQRIKGNTLAEKAEFFKGKVERIG